jgi:hypothetical protein
MNGGCMDHQTADVVELLDRIVELFTSAPA